MDEILYKCILIVLTAVFSMIGTYVSNYLKKITENEIIDRVVDDTVLYVEQVFTDVKGQEKLNAAIQKASKLLNEKGINITGEELEVLIESSVNSFKEQFENDKKLKLNKE